MSFRTHSTAPIGILGGGQLGMLLALDLRQRGIETHLYLEKDQDAPARALAKKVVVGQGWNDKEALKKFCQDCSIVILENEFVPVEILREMSDTAFFPNLESFGIFQDKYKEKTLAKNCGIATADFALVESAADVQSLMNKWDKLVLKTCRGGYDGTGNLTVTLASTIETIEAFLKQGPCLAERWINFSSEVAVMVARSSSNEVVFPLAETIQHHHICHQVIAPGRFSTELQEKIKTAALKLVRAAHGVGLFGVEFFISEAGDVIYNETAPRPHNSAHFTIEGCTLSQFAALNQIALGLEPKSPQLKTNCVGMLNLLGTPNGTGKIEPHDLFKDDPRGHLWLYGKKESRPGRKMGHYTLLGDDPTVILDRLTQLQQRYVL